MKILNKLWDLVDGVSIGLELYFKYTIISFILTTIGLVWILTLFILEQGGKDITYLSCLVLLMFKLLTLKVIYLISISIGKQIGRKK